MSNKKSANSQGRQQPDLADDLKRRARRRLVGATVLFITALLVVPALIENPPSQTESPIELVVPQRPSNIEPFSSNGAAQSSNEQAPIKPLMQGEATDPIEAAENKPKLVNSGPKEPLKSKEAREPAEVKAVEKKPAASNEAKQPKVEKPTQTVTPKVTPKPEEDPIAKFAQAEPVYWVQVAALSDKSRAEQMRDKLATLNYAAKIESVKTDVGQVYRVRVGPLAGLTSATDTKEKLKTAGYNGRVVK